MPIHFKLKDNKLVIDPRDLTEPAFYDIWKADKDRWKKRATMHLTFLWRMCSLESNLDKRSPRDRRILALQDTYRSKDPQWTDAEKKLIAIAEQVYLESNKTVIHFAAQELDDTIYLMKDIVRERKPVSRDVFDEDGNYLKSVSNMKQIKDDWNHVLSMQETRDKLLLQLNQEVEEAKQKKEASKKPSGLETGKIKRYANPEDRPKLD